MSKLYSSFTLRGLELSNRIVVSPMCQYSAENGMANDWHLVHLGSRAVGRAGLVFTEAAAVSPEGRISPSDLGIWSDEHIEPLKRITTFIKAQGVCSGIQLAHAGRKASCQPPWQGGKQISPIAGGWQTVAPTPLPFYENDVTPTELSIEEIQTIIQSFVNAAKRAVSAGFEIIEIHAAHGYLLNQFLSPLTNKRKDKYGGSFENRMRLLIEVIKGIRAVIPQEMPLFVRISAEEWAPGGHTIDESVEVATLLKTNGVDLIDCSSGGVVREQNIPVKANYQVPFAEKIRKEVNIATGAVGLITDVYQADDILDKDEADLIFIGREMLRNPYFALLGADQMHIIPNWPKQYERGKP
ncbi:NADPH dehydrogenase [uncultured Dysgonomonas sp.]|jgi:2,4-dienoyl-CoA reductase-like NADH-dependent reductase (Old Yellow Enzyme family)|uniref:NADPH dehydrogenase n=1 Tax=uncultured Dysgonomonas sp. TaxID=206096 RepID=A0A212JXT6_9BACT|nr:NADH:flavin oxidoreductase/NADH oxidase [Proteiniphilum sp.]MEA5128023.1 NADH:flavin oxidoreductase/NADH oxidase [Proteiniphilum sp.]SBW04198.1 NADPH dehydrogenase [uncultured Dysgonomonas sp.]